MTDRSVKSVESLLQEFTNLMERASNTHEAQWGEAERLITIFRLRAEAAEHARGITIDDSMRANAELARKVGMSHVTICVPLELILK
jgi:hypothetical protein